MIPAIIGAAALLGSAALSQAGNSAASKRELQAKKDAARKLQQQGKLTQTEYENLVDQIDEYYAQRGSLGTADDVDAYKNSISNYNPEDYAYKPGEFTYDKTKEDFLNPYYSAIIGDTANEIQARASGAGLGRGTGAALNIAKGVATKENELYRTALQDYTQDRDFAYKTYQDAITNNQNYLNALQSGNQYKIGIQGNLANNYYNTLDAAEQARLNAQTDALNAKQAYDTAVIGMY